MALLSLVQIAVAQGGNVITVGTGGQYNSIQQAIDSASAGDTIAVNGCTYLENVIINKPLTLKGMDDGGGKPTINSGGRGNAVSISADSVVLKGFLITGSGFSNAGVRINGDNCRIENCVIYGNGHGIASTGHSGNILYENVLYSNSADGILEENGGENDIEANDIHDNHIGIELKKSSNNRISGNTINDNGLNGIALNGASGNTIEGNTVQHSGDDGIYLKESSDGNVITGNTVSYNALDSVEYDNKNAVHLYQSNGNIVSYNTMRHNGGTLYRDSGSRTYRCGDAVQFEDTRDNMAIGNTAIDDHYAVWIYKSVNCSAIGNQAYGDENKFYYDIIVEDSSDSTVADNVLSDGERIIWIKNSDNNVIRNNTLSNAGFPSYKDYVMMVSDSDGNIIDNNTLRDSKYVYNSLTLLNSNGNTLTGNEDYNNGGSPSLTQSMNNRLYLNDFLDGIYSASPGNYWTSPGPVSYEYRGNEADSIVGNHYSDYYGTDGNGNGIGDSGYGSHGVSDPFPLMESHDQYLPPGTATPVPTYMATPSPTPSPTPAGSQEPRGLWDIIKSLLWPFLAKMLVQCLVLPYRYIQWML